LFIDDVSQDALWEPKHQDMVDVRGYGGERDGNWTLRVNASAVILQ